MSTTGCHVHFPDTHRNKSSPTTAKNQVSIVGLAESAEHARRQVRSLLPLTISFDVPSNVPPEAVCMTPAIRAIADEFHVTIFFKQRMGRGPLALIKGRA